MDSREEIVERGLEAVYLTRNRWGVVIVGLMVAVVFLFPLFERLWSLETYAEEAAGKESLCGGIGP